MKGKIGWTYREVLNLKQLKVQGLKLKKRKKKKKKKKKKKIHKGMN